MQTDEIGVACIYCNYNDQDHTAVNLLSSLLQQLVQQQSNIPDTIANLYERHTEKRTRPSLTEFSSQLQSQLRRFSRVFIVVDALDECPEGKGNRESFLKELRKFPSNVHLLVTSRYISDIGREFGRSTPLQIHASNEDIGKYLETRIQGQPRLEWHLTADPTLQSTIISTIVKKAHGMFVQPTFCSARSV